MQISSSSSVLWLKYQKFLKKNISQNNQFDTDNVHESQL